MASAGVGRAVAWLAEQQGRAADTAEPVAALVSRLIDIWPVDDSHSGGSGGAGTVRLFPEFGDGEEVATSAESVRAEMLRLLAAEGDATLGVRFLDRVVRAHYGGGEHDALLAVVELIGPSAAGKFLPDFVREHFASLAKDNLTLLREVGELGTQPPEFESDLDGLRQAVAAAAGLD